MTRRVRRWLAAIIVVVVVIGGAYLIGVRCFVMTPDDIPGGATLILLGARDLQVVDSPAAYCIRHGDKPDLACRGAIGITIGEESLLARFGYVDWLYRLSGVPAAANS